MYCTPANMDKKVSAEDFDRAASGKPVHFQRDNQRFVLISEEVYEKNRRLSEEGYFQHLDELEAAGDQQALDRELASVQPSRESLEKISQRCPADLKRWRKQNKSPF